MIRVYAAACYLLFLATLIYFVGWLANVGVPSGIDASATASSGVSIAVDLALLNVFAVQHSVMARPEFKERTRSLIPRSAERATYVLLSSVAVDLLVWQWRPLVGVVWDVEPSPWRIALDVAGVAGWVIVLVSTFMIGHGDMFGLKQAWRRSEYREPGFGRPGFYAWIRHPIMSGFIVAFWATPRMTTGHLLFAAASTAYILVAVRLEERDLHRGLGLAYAVYAAEVPRFVPALSLRHLRRRLDASGDPRSPSRRTTSHESSAQPRPDHQLHPTPALRRQARRLAPGGRSSPRRSDPGSPGPA